MTTAYTVTLSRGHKIADRLGSAIGEIKAEAERLCEQVSMSGYADAQIDQLERNSHKAVKLMAHHSVVANAQADVRSAIGRANAAAGVGDQLSKIEANKKILALLDAVLTAQRPGSRGAVHFSGLHAYKSIGSSDSIARRSSDVTVILLDAVQIEQLEERKKAIERENFALSDKLAEINAQKVTFHLEDDVATLAGLK